MSLPEPLSVIVWRRVSGATWAQVTEVDAWASLSVEIRHLQAGPWQLVLPYDAQTAKITKQHLLTFTFRGQTTTLLPTRIGPKLDENGGVVLELSGIDALGLLAGAVCYPAPALALDKQDVAHYTRTGPAEDVLRNLITANLVNRRGDGIRVLSSQGRGKTITVNLRFTNLLEVVARKCLAANLGVRVGLVQASPYDTRADLTCWFYQPGDRSNRVYLSSEVGTLKTWAESNDAPTGTRAVIGGGGQGTQRVFREVVLTDTEAEWGWVQEVFIDARDTTDPAVLDERAVESLTEMAAQSSFDLESTDAVGMRYGVHFALGDLVTIELLTGVSTVDRLNAVIVTATIEDGINVQLRPGNPDVEPMFKQAAIVAGIRRQLRAIQQEDS